MKMKIKLPKKINVHNLLKCKQNRITHNIQRRCWDEVNFEYSFLIYQVI